MNYRNQLLSIKRNVDSMLMESYRSGSPMEGLDMSITAGLDLAGEYARSLGDIAFVATGYLDKFIPGVTSQIGDAATRTGLDLERLTTAMSAPLEGQSVEERDEAFEKIEKRLEDLTQEDFERLAAKEAGKDQGIGAKIYKFLKKILGKIRGYMNSTGFAMIGFTLLVISVAPIITDPSKFFKAISNSYKDIMSKISNAGTIEALIKIVIAPFQMIINVSYELGGKVGLSIAMIGSIALINAAAFAFEA